MIKTIDYKFSELCEEIDHWKSEAKHYRTMYEEEVARSNDMVNQQLASSKRDLANALMFTLSVEDNGDGSLSISKENRKHLCDNYQPAN